MADSEQEYVPQLIAIADVLEKHLREECAHHNEEEK